MNKLIIKRYIGYAGQVGIVLVSLYKYVRPDIMKDRLLDDRTPEQVADVIKFLCEKNSQDNYSGIFNYGNIFYL